RQPGRDDQRRLRPARPAVPLPERTSQSADVGERPRVSGPRHTPGATMPDTVPNASVHVQLAAEVAAAGGPVEADPLDAGAVGRTMFDLPGSTDLTVTVLLPNEHLHAAPAQSLVRIFSKRDGRRYLGVVSAGPFAEPDGLK